MATNPGQPGGEPAAAAAASAPGSNKYFYAQSGKRKAEGEAQEDLCEDSSVSDPLVAEYLCPITQELPIDPVLAEDGRCYERDAITKWLSMDQSTAGVRSPVTNEPLESARVIPNVLVRGMVRKLRESGAVLD